jgi:hypothetical protein
MDTGIWRSEGLTIRLLAEDLSVPEHRLRALINDRLGYRNFADFLNAKRIGAAKLRLANAEEVRSVHSTVPSRRQPARRRLPGDEWRLAGRRNPKFDPDFEIGE